MSRLIKEKDLQSSSKGDLEADFLLNKHIFRTLAYSAAGFGVGLAASLFFKHKATMTAFFTGSGAGFGLGGLTSDWSNYHRQKNWFQAQNQRFQRENDNDRLSARDMEGYMMKQLSQSQKGQEKFNQQKDENRFDRQKEERRDDRSSQQKEENRFERSGQKREDNKPSQQKNENKFERQKEERRDDKPTQKRDENKQERPVQQREEKRDDKPIQKRDENKQEKSGQQKQEQQKQNKDFKRDETQQGKQGSQSQQQSQQNKQQPQKQSGSERPLNFEAQQKRDIAEQGKRENMKQGTQESKTPDPKNLSQSSMPIREPTRDKLKREEQAVYSQTMQGFKHNQDEVQRGERGPQNTMIPPSQRDWHGGHANQDVKPGQVHRGAAEHDKLGKSVAPEKAPNKQPDKGNIPNQENQALSNIDLKGQHLQTFVSNTQPLGKAGMAHEIKKDYQEGRNRANDPDLDNLKRRQTGIEQDRMGQTIKEGNTNRVREPTPSTTDSAVFRPKNQVNTVTE